METQKLPNATLSIVLGIISFIGCCCTSGIGGVILSGIALILAVKDQKTYAENPELYYNYNQVRTAKIIAIISLVLSLIIVLIYIYMLATGQLENMEEKYLELIEEFQNQNQ